MGEDQKACELLPRWIEHHLWVIGPVYSSEGDLWGMRKRFFSQNKQLERWYFDVPQFPQKISWMNNIPFIYAPKQVEILGLAHKVANQTTHFQPPFHDGHLKSRTVLESYMILEVVFHTTPSATYVHLDLICSGNVYCWPYSSNMPRTKKSPPKRIHEVCQSVEGQTQPVNSCTDTVSCKNPS